METGHSSTTYAMRRAACDRCHDSKSRCSKDVDSDSCQRCTRLGLPCTHRPPLRMGRPRENAGQRSSGQNAVPSIGESQDGALRGKKRGGRPRRASQPQNVPSRTKVARNEQGAYVPVLWDQGPAVVAEEADTQHGLGKAYVTTSPSTPSNSCDSVLWISGSNRSTTRDTSDISEGIWDKSLVPACQVSNVLIAQTFLPSAARLLYRPRRSSTNSHLTNSKPLGRRYGCRRMSVIGCYQP